MAKKKFKMSSKATKEAAKKANSTGSSIKQFKMDENRVSAEVLILGPVEDDAPAIFTTKKHQIWKDKRPVSVVGTPSVNANGDATGEKDKIMEIGWKLREKYKDSENEKKKTFWQKFLPDTQHHICVLDLKNVEAGPLVYSMPKMVADFVIDEINEHSDDLTSICDFDEGRKLYIKHNGEKGMNRKYKVVKFKGEAKLLEDGLIEEEDLDEIAEKMPDLRRLQPKFDQDAFDTHLEKLAKMAQKIGIDLDDLDVDSDEDDDELEESEDENEELEVDEDDIIDEDEDIVVDEEDEDGEDDKDDDEEEDDEEEEKKKTSKRSKAASKKTSKKRSRRRR